MQPAFFSTYKTVAVPFGSRVIAQWPREHCLVNNGSFGDRVVDGTYLYSDSATPCIWMFSIALQRKFKVQDFKSYSLQFPLKDPSCLTRSTPTMMKEMSKVREEDAHDDNLIALETSNQIDTRAQMRAAENAANSHILETTDVDNNTNSPLHVLTQLCLLLTKHATTLHFCHLFCRRVPILSMLQPPHALPFNTMELASIYTQTLLITAKSKSQKHVHVILSRLACQSTTHRIM